MDKVTPTTLNVFQSAVSKELNLLFNILEGFIDNQEDISNCNFEIDHDGWSEFEQLSIIHKTYPICHQMLKGQSKIPSTIIKNLTSYTVSIAIYNKMITDELCSALKVLNENGITAIPIRGSFLASQYYKDLSLRPFIDLDVFIFAKDAIKAKNLLLDHGYDEFHALNNRLEKKVTSNEYEYSLIKSIDQLNTQFLIEFHWGFLNPNKIDLPLPLEKLKDGIIEGDVIGMKCLTFDHEKTLIVNLINGGVKDLWYPIKHLVDLSLIVKQGDTISWPRMIDQLEELKFKSVILTGFYIIQELLHQELPDEINSELKGNDEVQVLATLLLSKYQKMKEPNALEKLRFYLKDISGLKAKIRFTYKYLTYYITPNKFDQQDLNLPWYLGFLYYFSRVSRVFKKYK